MDSETLAPRLLVCDSHKTAELQAVLICETIERRAVNGKSLDNLYIDDILLWAKSTEDEFNGCRFEAGPGEVRIHISDSNVCIRYYDSGMETAKINTFTPFMDIAGTAIAVVNGRINRQIFHKALALPASAQASYAETRAPPEARESRYDIEAGGIIEKYRDYRQFLSEVDGLSLQQIRERFLSIDAYIASRQRPLHAFAELPAEVRNAYFTLIAKGFEKGSRIFMESKFLDLDRSQQLYNDSLYDGVIERCYRDPIKTVLNYLIDGDPRLDRRTTSKSGEKISASDEGKDLNFATVGMSIMSMLVLNGLSPDDFNMNIIDGAPRFFSINAIKDYRDLKGDATKHSLGNKYWPFAPNVAIKQISLLRAFGVDARYYDISSGTEGLDKMLGEIDENTIITFGFRDPVQYGDVVTAKKIATYCASRFHGRPGPLISTGGIAVASQIDLLSCRVYIKEDGTAVLKRHPDSSMEGLPGRKVFDVLHRTYSETNLLQLLFGYWTDKEWDESKGVPREIAKLPNAWYYNEHAALERRSPYQCRVVHTSTRSLRRTVAMHGLWDYRIYDFGKFWRTKVTPAEKLHPKNRYFDHSMEHTTEHGDCAVGCDFCGYTGFVSMQAKIPVDMAINNIKRAKSAYPELKMIIYNDGNFLSNKKWAKEFFKRYREEVLPLGVTTFIQAPVYYCQNDEFLEEMRDSGVEILCVGQEGVGMQFLLDIGKLKNPAVYWQFKAAPRKIAAAGIRWPRTSWIMFHPKKDQKEAMDTMDEILEQIKMGVVTFAGAFAMCKRSSGLVVNQKEWAKYGRHTIKIEVQDGPEDDPFTAHLAFLPPDKALRESSLKSVETLDGYIEHFRRINGIDKDMPEQVEVALFIQLVLRNLFEHPENKIAPEQIRNMMNKSDEALTYLLSRTVISGRSDDDKGLETAAPAPDGERDSPFIDFLQRNTRLVSTLLNDSKDVMLLRIPVEALEAAGVDNISGFLNAFQGSDNGYIELYYMSGTGELTEEQKDALHMKYKVYRKPLPNGFEKRKDNTISLFALLKGEIDSNEQNATKDIDRLLKLRLGRVSPDKTQIVPVGLQHDATGLMRGVLMGIRLIHIFRQKKAFGAVNQEFVKETIEQYKALCLTQGIGGFNLSDSDIVAIASGNYNDLLKALQKFIKLLPIKPINAEELRQIYDLAAKILIAA